MAAYGQPPNLGRVMAAVQPRNGFPVRNMGGLPQTPMTTPPKPFVSGPTLAAGPPGPAPSPNRGFMEGEPIPGGGGVPVPIPGKPGGVPAGPSTATTPSPIPPPAPAAPTPGPPAPTPPQPGTSSSSSSGSSGQTGANTPAGGWNLEGQLQNFLSGAFNGSVTPEFIQRAREQVFRNVQGQTRQATNRINEDAVRRGLYRSGIPAEGIANVEAGAQGAIASGVADILNSAENQNIQGRQNAAGLAGNLLGQNRSWEQWNTERADAAAARAGANQPRTFQYIDPDTGQAYEMNEDWF